MKKPARFKQGDVARALKAASSAGFKVSRVEIEPDGKLCLLMADGALVDQPSTPFDAWREKRNARPA
jgi:hypothetical protein